MNVLTDIEINQSKRWTDSVAQLQKEGGLIDRFLTLIKVMKKNDVFISADIKLSQLYGLFRAFGFHSRKSHIVLELMLDEERNSLQWKLKRWLQRFCFSTVDCVFVSASNEVSTYAQRFNLPESKFSFLPFHTNIIEPKILDTNKGFILSAGRTGRDYETLAKAVDGLDVNVVIIGDKDHIAGIDFPDNIDVRCEIPYEEYMACMEECALVVVPLKKLVKSTGQVVFLEAMALGKPVIATETTGTTDYIENGVTGALAPPYDVSALRELIVEFQNNPETYTKYAEAAFQKVNEKYTFDAYVSVILEMAKKFHSKTAA